MILMILIADSALSKETQWSSDKFWIFTNTRNAKLCLILSPDY